MNARSINHLSIMLMFWLVPAVFSGRYNSVQSFSPGDTMVPLIKHARQGIVNIEARMPITDKMGRFGEALRSHLDETGTSQPKWYVSLGSGIIWNKDGYIITTKSVIKTSGNIIVRTLDGQNYSARLIGTDDITNIAVLHLNGNLPDHIQPLSHRTEKLYEGSSLVLMGYGYGGIPTISPGMAGIPPEDYDPGRHWFQFTAPLRPGNSGSALVDSSGCLAGIALGREEDLGFNAVIRMLTGQNESNFSQSQITSCSSLGIGIPINLAAPVVEQIIQSGRVVRGWIGISVRVLPASAAHDEHTLQVVRIIPGSPAEDAGLQVGDTILCVNGMTVQDPKDLGRIVREHPPGSRISLDFTRNGVDLRTEITVSERPAQKDLLHDEIPDKTSSLFTDIQLLENNLLNS
jgi:S1-C subfamily serine protease